MDGQSTKHWAARTPGAMLRHENNDIESYRAWPTDHRAASGRRTRPDRAGLAPQPAHVLLWWLFRPGPHGLPLVARDQRRRGGGGRGFWRASASRRGDLQLRD